MNTVLNTVNEVVPKSGTTSFYFDLAIIAMTS